MTSTSTRAQKYVPDSRSLPIFIVHSPSNSKNLRVALPITPMKLPIALDDEDDVSDADDLEAELERELARAPSSEPEDIKPAQAYSIPQQQHSSSKKNENHPPAIEVEEESLEFGQPSRPLKRSRKTPPPPPAIADDYLALPGRDSFAFTPPSIVGGNDDSEEDEWDEVAAAVPNADDGEEEEIDINAFGAELEMHLAASADNSGDEVEELKGGQRPLSMSQLAEELSADDDDSSSSDDSD